MVIFDFDQTLVDTQLIQELRKQKRWEEARVRLLATEAYIGITELLRELDGYGQKLAIVTTSPDRPVVDFIRQHRWPIDIVIGYHQVKKIKPDPEGLITAMKKAGDTPEKTFHVGDQPKDTAASRAAKVMALGAGWGLADIEALRASAPDHLFMSVSDLRAFLLNN